MRVTVDMEDKYLHSVTTEKRHLNKKSKFSGKSFNFYGCSDKVMQQILQTNDNIVMKFGDGNKLYRTRRDFLGLLDIFNFIIKKSPVPKTWRNAYAAITDETVIENWRKERNKK